MKTEFIRRMRDQLAVLASERAGHADQAAALALVAEADVMLDRGQGATSLRCRHGVVLPHECRQCEEDAFCADDDSATFPASTVRRLWELKEHYRLIASERLEQPGGALSDSDIDRIAQRWMASDSEANAADVRAIVRATTAVQVRQIAYRIVRQEEIGKRFDDGPVWSTGVPSKEFVHSVNQNEGWAMEYAYSAPDAVVFVPWSANQVAGHGAVLDGEGNAVCVGLTGAQASAIVDAHNCGLDQHGYFTQATLDVLAERRRQIQAEGFTLERDDGYNPGELVAAGAAYALNAADQLHPFSQGSKENAQPVMWPWDAKWWKPGPPRRDLVKAVALALAEIERIDRIAAKGSS